MFKKGLGCVAVQEKAERFGSLAMENLPKCNYCYSPDFEKEFKRCSACKTIFYCSEEHQRKDWSEKHKVYSSHYLIFLVCVLQAQVGSPFLKL
jgi:hypothetical protein